MRKLEFLAGLLCLFCIGGCDINSDSLEEENNVSTESPDNEQATSDADLNNYEAHEATGDYDWNNSEVNEIVFNGNSISENCDGASATGSILNISAGGTYQLNGTLTNGRVIVEATENDLVRLLLNNVEITNESSAPITIKSAEKVIVVLNKDTKNTITDGNSYQYDNTEKEEPNAALFSKTNLTVYGEGELYINANFNDAINCKDGLIVDCGKMNITSIDEGIRGKDYLIIKKGNFTIDSGGDGFKSDNDEDETRGYIKILTGDFNISAKGDAISACTDVLIEDGDYNLITSGTVTNTNGVSSKAIKSGINTIINSGNFIIETTEDAIHSDQTLAINGGTFTISANDDGIHTDYDLVINDGDFTVTKSYEAIECGTGNMYIYGGNFQLVASDDGINLAGDGDMMGGHGGPGGGWGGTTSSANYTIYLKPEKLAINAQGDGIDANGSVEVTDGIIIIHGPTGNGNGILDYDQTFIQNGGTLIAAGSSGMFQAPGSSSTQNCVAFGFSNTQSAGSLCHIQTSDGDALCTIKPEKNYSAFLYCSPDLKQGIEYNLYTGGSVTGSSFSGYYTDETYTAGTKQTSFSLSKTITGIQIN